MAFFCLTQTHFHTHTHTLAHGINMVTRWHVVFASHACTHRHTHKRTHFLDSIVDKRGIPGAKAKLFGNRRGLQTLRASMEWTRLCGCILRKWIYDDAYFRWPAVETQPHIVVDGWIDFVFARGTRVLISHFVNSGDNPISSGQPQQIWTENRAMGQKGFRSNIPCYYYILLRRHNTSCGLFAC